MPYRVIVQRILTTSAICTENEYIYKLLLLLLFFFLTYLPLIAPKVPILIMGAHNNTYLSIFKSGL